MHKLIVMPKALFSLDRLIAFYTDQSCPFPEGTARVIVVHVISGLLELHQHDSISHVRMCCDLVCYSSTCAASVVGSSGSRQIWQDTWQTMSCIHFIAAKQVCP